MVVDGLVETEEVLKAVLEPRGMQVTRISTTRHPDAPMAQDQPSVIVLHESEDLTNRSSHRNAATSWDAVPRVVIGRIQTRANQREQDCRYLSQPFQYAELVTAIESLLQSAPHGL